MLGIEPGMDGVPARDNDEDSIGHPAPFGEGSIGMSQAFKDPYRQHCAERAILDSNRVGRPR